MRLIKELRKIGPMVDIGGLNLLLFKMEDRIFGGNNGGEYKYNIMKQADVEEYPRLIKDLYKITMGGGGVNLCNPQYFTEKIQWLKIYDTTSLKSKLTDKYQVREWIHEKIGSKHLIPLLGVWDTFEDISFSSLPQKCILKCNHGSNMNLIVNRTEMLDKEKYREQFDKWMCVDYAFAGSLELQYKDIPKKIIAEKYIEEMNGSLKDYKFHCFGGTPVFIQCIGDRDLKNHTGYQKNYDINWHELDWTFEDYPRFPYEVSRPAMLSEMVEIAKILSKDFLYVRVDLYEIKGSIYFGEMTFTPASGYYQHKGTFTKEIDKRLGDLITLPT